MTHMGDKSGTLSPNQIPDIVWQINDWIWLVYWMSMLPIECVTPVSLQWWLFTLPIIIMIQFVSIWLTTFTQIFLLRIKRLRLNTTNYEEQFHSQIRVTFHQQKKVMSHQVLAMWTFRYSFFWEHCMRKKAQYSLHKWSKKEFRLYSPIIHVAWSVGNAVEVDQHLILFACMRCRSDKMYLLTW